MVNEKSKAAETAKFIKRSTSSQPKIGILMGTGLGETLGSLVPEAGYDYEELPHFPVSTEKWGSSS